MTTPKSATLGSITLLGLSFLLTSAAFAETTSRAKLIAERDAILVQFVQDAESHYGLGTVTAEDVFQAKRTLFTFRRDYASTVEDKVTNQQLIIRLIEERVREVEARFTAGVSTTQNILREKDRLLEAQLQLEDLRAGIALR